MLDVSSTTSLLMELRRRQQPLGYDIEGSLDVGITVCSFAWSAGAALSIPFRRFDWSEVWSTDDRKVLLGAVGAVLQDPAVPKVMHNAAFESFVLRWLHDIRITNVHDSMIGWHCLYPELQKGLEIVASVLTRQPYWGTPDDWTDDFSRDHYNAIDAMVCLEAWLAEMALMTPTQRAYYDHCIALLEPVLDMMHQGFAYDVVARDTLVARIEREIRSLQGELDGLALIAHPTFDEVKQAVAMKLRHERCLDWPDLLTWAKPTMREPL